MDNITHSLTGLALSRAGLERFCPRAVWLLILSANAPDADIAAASQGAFRYLEVHRGYTHSFTGLPVMAGLTVVVIAAIFRQRLPWFRAWLICLAGVASHLLLDTTNSYGVRLLLPFSSRWSHLDLNGLYDVPILAVLAFAAIWPSFSRMVSREIGDRASSAGRSLALFALGFFLLYDFGRWLLHERAVMQLESRLYDGAPPLQAAALPDSFSPLRWTGVVETKNAYLLPAVNPIGSVYLTYPAIFRKPAVTPTLTAARSVDPFRYFLYFARFPVWWLEPVTGEHTQGIRLDLTDLRFGRPGAGAFHCIGYEDATNRLVAKWYTYSSGMDLGWNEQGGSVGSPK
ncbi:MAG: metal-dependent hydrolase [Acidobacteriaceae bacterium]|nr:metal-dependent hydrolase [Acidobacteriaceae bacterium]